MSPKAAPDYPGILAAAKRIASPLAEAEHDREVAAKAWDEGLNVGVAWASGHLTAAPTNPYREES